MQIWYGASGICINENAEMLMVLQGNHNEKKTWSVPSGGLEKNESFKECCIREIEEETGFIVDVIDEIKIKRGHYETLNISFEVHYFLVKIIGGERKIQDPDKLILDIEWKSSDEIKALDLTYPEDKDFLIDCIHKRNEKFISY